MAEIQRDLNRQKSSGNLGKARQRRLHREGELNVSPKIGQVTNRRHNRSQHSSKRTSTSVRERLAENNINFQPPSLQALQEKLSSTFGVNPPRRSAGRASGKLTALSNLFTPRRPRRRAETRHSDHKSKLEVPHSVKSQRVAESTPEFHPRKGRKASSAHGKMTPPVMVRGGVGGMAFGRVASSRFKKQNPLKRRFDVALDVPGAELRLPSIPMIHLGWRALSGVMVVMLIACLFVIWKAPAFQVNTVEAEGLQRLTVGDLNTVMGIFGKSIFSVDPNQLEKSLRQAFPELSTLSIKINLPASVSIVVTERQPVVAWIQDGTEVWVDAEGVSFPPRGNPGTLVRVEGHGNLPTVTTQATVSNLPGVPPSIIPAVTPTISTLRLPPELVFGILTMSAQMPADTLLVYDSEHGLGWNDPNGWEVFFGTQGKDMDMKLSVYQALVADLQNEGIQPAMISVEYVHAPYYRMER